LDPDFHRGESAHDRYYGDPEHMPNPCVGEIKTAPYYAIQIFPGSVGTKGGVKTDTCGRVLDRNRRDIPKLFACGSAMSSAMGMGYPGAGGMLGPGLTFAYLAGGQAGWCSQ
jgi:succinate dehydrogenase/fumarate reductase flavoprotein subunit